MKRGVLKHILGIILLTHGDVYTRKNTPGQREGAFSFHALVTVNSKTPAGNIPGNEQENHSNKKDPAINQVK